MGEPIITFEARDEWFGLPARDILEVAELRGVRAVPRAPAVVAGLAEVHGRIVTLIDLERLLPPGGAGPAREGSIGVVLAPPHDHLGILVRSAVDVAPQAPAAAPDPGAPRSPERPDEAGLLAARLPVGERLLNLLSLQALIARVEEAIRAGFLPAAGAPKEAD